MDKNRSNVRYFWTTKYSKLALKYRNDKPELSVKPALAKRGGSALPGNRELSKQVENLVIELG